MVLVASLYIQERVDVCMLVQGEWQAKTRAKEGGSDLDVRDLVQVEKVGGLQLANE
jgi:hypothetical protein